MQLDRAGVVLGAARPDAVVGHAVGALDGEHEVLHERHLLARLDDLRTSETGGEELSGAELSCFRRAIGAAGTCGE